MTTISYAITACNEYKELVTLFKKILPHVKTDDEVVVLLDTDNTTNEVDALCEEYRVLPNFHVHYNKLNKDFAAHKNFLNKMCSKDWIFNIDADEYPSDILLNNLKDILRLNYEVDLIAVPRVNRVIGITPEHIAKWRWHYDEQERINWPDYQLRIYKNTEVIKWDGKVHERPVGWLSGTHLPIETDEFALVHIKDVVRQEKQNSLYDTIH